MSQAVQDTARLHQAAKLAAAVALPPPPAPTAPGMAGNVGRASAADLFTATPPVFGPTSAGGLVTIHYFCVTQCHHTKLFSVYNLTWRCFAETAVATCILRHNALNVCSETREIAAVVVCTTPAIVGTMLLQR